jgi:NADH-quinone oxidoreductase subunit L
MVARSAPLFDLAPLTLGVVAWIGALTAILAATIALVQTDIKRVIAYSTISQLGYMFLGAGLGAYAAAIFHLATHAFFKALLFLGAGSVIHGLHGEQDLRRMGGLRRHMPITAVTFLVAALANAGIFPLAGFWSKDEILHAALAHRQPGLLLLGVAGAFLTGLYMMRAYYLAFEGASRAEKHAHESPGVMSGPLVVLAVFAAGVGFVGFPPGHGVFHAFLAPVWRAAEGGHESGALPLALVSLGVAAAGIAVATWLYVLRPDMPARMAARYSWVHRMLLNKYYVDEAYDRFIVQPIKRASIALWRRMDEPVVDGAVNGVGAIVQAGSLLLRRVQTGYVMSYVLSFLVGVVAVVGYLAFSR